MECLLDGEALHLRLPESLDAAFRILPVPDPRKALRWVISKINFDQVCQLLTTISQKMAPRMRQSEVGITPRRAFCGLHAAAFDASGCNFSQPHPACLSKVDVSEVDDVVKCRV